MDKHRNLEKIQKAAPVIEQQFDKVSDKMNTITMQVMNYRVVDANSIKQSENFNNIIV